MCCFEFGVKAQFAILFMSCSMWQNHVSLVSIKVRMLPRRNSLGFILVLLLLSDQKHWNPHDIIKHDSVLKLQLFSSLLEGVIEIIFKLLFITGCRLQTDPGESRCWSVWQNCKEQQSLVIKLSVQRLEVQFQPAVERDYAANCYLTAVKALAIFFYHWFALENV